MLVVPEKKPSSVLRFRDGFFDASWTPWGGWPRSIGLVETAGVEEMAAADKIRGGKSLKERCLAYVLGRRKGGQRRQKIADVPPEWMGTSACSPRNTY